MKVLNNLFDPLHQIFSAWFVSTLTKIIYSSRKQSSRRVLCRSWAPWRKQRYMHLQWPMQQSYMHLTARQYWAIRPPHGHDYTSVCMPTPDSYSYHGDIRDSHEVVAYIWRWRGSSLAHAGTCRPCQREIIPESQTEESRWKNQLQGTVGNSIYLFICQVPSFH